ncbi:hypothetical protein AVEN_158620-1 [Araneus ventricosus]|uniref:Uncharacterized protein n=1 Tax=Araneus ventricosus TaxID=182803 RepID=A0A4Y2I695_ARAVE|nr:hypothetical protein AVEN_158620-1 [Araneus ventricosus]
MFRITRDGYSGSPGLCQHHSVTPVCGPAGLTSFLHTKAFFGPCAQVTEVANLIIGELWKYHFHIVACLKIIESASRGYQESPLERSFGRRALSNVIWRGLRQYLWCL